MSDASRMRDTSKRNCIFVVTKYLTKITICHTREVVKHKLLHADYVVLCRQFYNLYIISRDVMMTKCAKVW